MYITGNGIGMDPSHQNGGEGRRVKELAGQTPRKPLNPRQSKHSRLMNIDAMDSEMGPAFDGPTRWSRRLDDKSANLTD